MTVRNVLLISSICALVLQAPIASVFAQDSSSEEPQAGRKAFQEQRPDESRGWLVVTKASYWPLCFESLDRLDEAKEMIGTAKPEELADQLDKCGAWLHMASSAAMTDGRAGIEDASGLCQVAAEDIRDGSSEWTSERLTNLIALCQICMAKSHMMRAGAPDQEESKRKLPGLTGKRKSLVKDISQANREIAAERREGAFAQYRYDAVESRRHLEVAMVYLDAAATTGGFEVTSELAAEIPELSDPANDSDVTNFVEYELRPRLTKLAPFIELYRKTIRSRIGEV